MVTESKDRTSAAIDAFMQGKDVGVAVGDEPVGGNEEDPVESESVLDELEDDTAEEPIESKEKPSVKGQPAKATAAAKAKADLEEIEADGKKIQIDYTNKEAVKKAHLEAAGMRKFQRERDEARKQLKESEKVVKEHGELSALWTKLETAFSNEGVAGVVKAITNGKTDLEALIEERANKKVKLQQASPAERAAMEREDKFDQEVKRREAIERELGEIKKRDQDLKEQAERTSLESAIHPAFNANRFKGKLGDEDVEHRFDKALWANVKSALEDLPDDQPITADMVNTMFKEEAAIIGRMLTRQAEAKADTIVKNRKTAAKEAAQGAVSSGTQLGSSKREFAKKIKGGNISGALEDLLTGRTKL